MIRPEEDCPFCGKDEIAVAYKADPHDDYGTTVCWHCLNCGAEGPPVSSKEMEAEALAAKKWDTRAGEAKGAS